MPDQPLIDAFGKRIRTLRTARGLSQEQLAELTGFHRTYIEMIERVGHASKIGIDSLITLRIGKSQVNCYSPTNETLLLLPVY